MTDLLVFAPQARADAARTVLGQACRATGLSVQLEVFGSSGSLFQRLRARRSPPAPDLVLWFGPYAAHSAALDNQLQAYQPPTLPRAAAHDASWHWVAVDYQSFAVTGAPQVSSFEDLAGATRLALVDPERSELGMLALLAVLDRARQANGDLEQGWQWWVRRIQAGVQLAVDENEARSAQTDGRVSHALGLQRGGLPLAGLAPVPHAISLPMGARSPDQARQLFDWLVGEGAAQPGSLSAWQASANGLQTLLSAAPALDVDWATRQYSALRTRWATAGFGPAVVGG